MKKSLDDIMDEWGDEQIAEAIQIIKTAQSSSSGFLIESLNFKVKNVAKGLLMTITEADYGIFVRKGVKGALSSSKAPKSPFSYKDKMPPKGAIDRWVVQKGISGTRNARGQFIKRKSLVFLIRRSIFRFGIRPLDYFSPFFKNINDLQGKIAEQQKREILLLLSEAFKPLKSK